MVKILLRLPADLLAAIDDYRFQHRHASRSAALLALLCAGLEADARMRGG